MQSARSCGYIFVCVYVFPRVCVTSWQVGIEDAVHTALLTLKEGFEGQLSSNNIEVGIIGADKKFRILSQAEVADYLLEVE